MWIKGGKYCFFFHLSVNHLSFYACGLKLGGTQPWNFYIIIMIEFFHKYEAIQGPLKPMLTLIDMQTGGQTDITNYCVRLTL